MKTFLLLSGFILISFTTTLNAQTVSLGVSSWWDMNNNGKRDATEPAASGNQIRLYQDNDDDGIADAGFTTIINQLDINGKFTFTNLAPGKYFTRLAAGYSHYKTTVYGGDPDNDIIGDNNGYSQDLSTYNIFSQTITLASGTEPDGSGATNTDVNNTLDFGMWKSNGLGDFVWVDANANGQQDVGEKGLAGVTVRLKNNSGAILATTSTDVNGYYSFYEPANYGTFDYQVEFVTPSGYTPTFTDMGGNDDNDSDAVDGLITGINVPLGNWNNSLDAGFRPLAPLPVKLLSFNAILNKTTVSLNWKTENEVNINFLEVERSIGNETFKNIGMLFPKGNATANNYSFSDEININEATVILYRLRFVNFSGFVEYSDIQKIIVPKTPNKDLAVIAYPNPVVNELHVQIPAKWQNKEISYLLYNQSGVVVNTLTNKAGKQIQNINVANLANGIYIVKAICNGEVAQQKIIKR